MDRVVCGWPVYRAILYDRALCTLTAGDLHGFERKAAEMSAYRNVEHYCNNVKGLKCMPDHQVNSFRYKSAFLSGER